MNKIILISGKQGSGKTTLSQNLTLSLRQKGFEVTQMKFADILYEMHDAVKEVAAKYNIPCDAKMGNLLQYLGTDLFRSKNPNVWADSLAERVRNALSFKPEKHIILVDDCRFKNEFSCLPEAFKIRLECSKEMREKRCQGWRDNDSHESEVNLDDYAEMGLFDLNLNTEDENQEETLEYVLNKLFQKPASLKLEICR